MGHIAFIGFGSNMGDKARRCEEAISEILKVDNHTLLAKSSFYKTRPVGYTAQDWFVNGVIKIETDLEAPDLFHALKAIENHLGRIETFRWGPRAIDLDLLLFDGACLETPEVTIPHPRLQERQFVLVPLAEIDPDLLHPVFKKSVRRLLEDMKEDQGVERLLDDC